MIIPALEALKDEPHVVVATTGGGRTVELRQRFARPNVVVEDFVDHDVLLPHVDVFSTNGASAACPPPSVTAFRLWRRARPRARTHICARVGHNHLPVDLRKERPKPSSIRAAVGRVLTDPTFSAQIGALRAELESYDPPARIETVLQKALHLAGH